MGAAVQRPKQCETLSPTMEGITMHYLLLQLRRLWHDESGLTTVEYAVAGSLITLAVVTAFTTLGTQVGTVLGEITTAIS